MRSAIITVLAVGALAAPGAARSETPPLCAAFENLAQSVQRTGQGRQVSYSILANSEVLSTCSLTPDDQLQHAYCAEALRIGGSELGHSYPWNLTNCLRASGVRVRLDARRGDTGILRDRRKVMRLSARLRSGVTVDLRFVPASTTGGARPADDYFGAYDLTLAPAPKA